jgi:hypothetical protein
VALVKKYLELKAQDALERAGPTQQGPPPPAPAPAAPPAAPGAAEPPRLGRAGGEGGRGA